MQRTNPSQMVQRTTATLIALIMNNMFLDVSRETRYLRGGEKSSTRELVCQNEPLSCRPPLPVIFPQTWRETELLGQLRWTCEEMGQCSKVTQFCHLHMLNEAKIYISEILIPAPVSSSTVSAPVLKIKSHKMSVSISLKKHCTRFRTDKKQKKQNVM